jgi:hypothetical protein
MGCPFSPRRHTCGRWWLRHPQAVASWAPVGPHAYAPIARRAALISLRPTGTHTLSLARPACPMLPDPRPRGCPRCRSSQHRCCLADSIRRLCLGPTWRARRPPQHGEASKLPEPAVSSRSRAAFATRPHHHHIAFSEENLLCCCAPSRRCSTNESVVSIPIAGSRDPLLPWVWFPFRTLLPHSLDD